MCGDDKSRWLGGREVTARKPDVDTTETAANLINGSAPTVSSLTRPVLSGASAVAPRMSPRVLSRGPQAVSPAGWPAPRLFRTARPGEEFPMTITAEAPGLVDVTSLIEAPPLAPTLADVAQLAGVSIA